MKAIEAGPVKLVTSMFTGDEGLFGAALGKLSGRFGPIDFLSETLEFDLTDYYEEEFGGGLKRRVASFGELVSPEELADMKLFTNSVEDGLSAGGRRRINIDPGYLSLERLVLASCKNFSHRVYIGKGVYAEVTLLFSGGGWRPLEWTYPDYRSAGMREMLLEIRKRYAFSIGRGLRLG